MTCFRQGRRRLPDEKGIETGAAVGTKHSPKKTNRRRRLPDEKGIETVQLPIAAQHRKTRMAAPPPR